LGEPGQGTGITWYDVLGVLPGASAEQVQQRYEAKASLLRPERLSGAPSPVVVAASRAQGILDGARRVLTDPARGRRPAAAGGAF
jgi:curved DNA-binding protein CbpA